MAIDLPVMTEATSLLHAHEIGIRHLIVADGFANTVLLTPTHVLRLNEGRFPQAFAHEARVLAHIPPSTPRPKVVAQGARDVGGEYLILERLPGNNLARDWPDISPALKLAISQQVGVHLRALHETEAAPWMENPWVADVQQSGRWRDAYHLPAETIPHAIDSAIRVRPALHQMLGRLQEFVDAWAEAIEGGTQGFVHTDVHLRNILTSEGMLSGVIDFEGSRIGPIDMELDQLVRYVMNAPDWIGYTPLIAGLRDTYPSMFSHPDLIARLEVYEAQWHLVQIHHWHPGASWTPDPAEGLRTLLSGEFAGRLRNVLSRESAYE